MSHSKKEKICTKCKSAAYDIFKKSTHREKAASEVEEEALEKDGDDSELLEKPRRFMTPYIAFVNSSWAEYCAANPDSQMDSASFKEFVRNCAGKWKEMAEEEKAPFEEQSAAEKAAYQELMVAYVTQQLELQGEDAFSKQSPPSDYVMFVVEEREKVRQELGPETNMVELGKELGRRWTALPSELKEAYKGKASEAREEYTDLSDYSDAEGVSSECGAESDDVSDFTGTSSFYSFYSSSGEGSYSYSDDDDDY
ncbi:PREDICTED: high mobility group protein B2-like [Rhagoletis zephyria]|uniref:high mobility group protein B2-like n=1 Tax=Rhagoletis zephyria TaxID=28612 RepID=UPI0008119783|nr:PREDICTED: high mobility group protein B2-like [Rhagoletis zephyria]KAH9398408.1 High mobility group [Tyrophagus putrescentiae]